MFLNKFFTLNQKVNADPWGFAPEFWQMSLYRRMPFPALLILLWFVLFLFFIFYNEYLIWFPPDKKQKQASE